MTCDLPLSYLPCRIIEETDIKNTNYDCVLLVAHCQGDSLPADISKGLGVHIKSFLKIDKSAGSCPTTIPVYDDLPHGRLVFSPVGPINRDYDDVRRFSDAGFAGIRKAISAGARKILLVTAPCAMYENAQLCVLLGVLSGLYVSSEARQGGVKPKADCIGFYTTNKADAVKIIRLAGALEAGRTVSRDIANGSPAYMTPPVAAKFVWGMLDRCEAIQADIIDDQSVIEKEYPIAAAVNRAVNKESKYEARIVKLTYNGEGPIEQTLMFVGKGVTFDTGGMDIKISSAMLGMSHDKGGAAAVAGFFKVLAVLRPRGIKVMATIPFVRNGIGPDAVTCDEIIVSRSGKRMRIINTDAEGRMIMVDPLCEMVEKAPAEKNPHLFTIATLTGHAVLTSGPGYGILVQNGQAVRLNTAAELKQAGESIGEPFDITCLRREDYTFHLTNSDEEDMIHSYAKPSTQTPRGHQIPVAFLIMGSGLDNHGIESDNPIPYTHMDIAGAEMGEKTNSVSAMSSGCPVLTLASKYIVPRVSL